MLIIFASMPLQKYMKSDRQPLTAGDSSSRHASVYTSKLSSRNRITAVYHIICLALHRSFPSPVDLLPPNLSHVSISYLTPSE